MKRLSMQRHIQRHLFIVLVYLGMIVLALDNLFLRFSTSLPGPGRTKDYAIFYWDMWWVKYALLNLKTDPFFTSVILYPSTHSLVTHTLAPFWGLLSMPLQSFLGLITIFNLFVALSFFLTAYLTFLFIYRKGVEVSIAFLAGFVVAFTPAMLQRTVDGHLNMLPMWWIPLTLLLFDKLVADRKWLTAVLLTFAVYAALLTDFQYMMWIPLVLLPYALYRFFSQDTKQKGQLLSLLIFSLIGFACLAYLYPIRYLPDLPLGDYPQASVETAHAYSFPLNALVEEGQADFTIGRLLLPLIILITAVGGVRGERWLWLLTGLGIFVLALGPYLLLSEDRRLILPYMLLHAAANGFYRVPVRFAVLATFCLSVFGSLAAQAAVNRYKPRPVVPLFTVGLICLLFIFDYRLPQPLPTFSPPLYETYKQIGNDAAAGVLLEVPLGVDTGFTLFGHGKELIFYQPTHQKAILNGALSRMPLAALDIYKSYNLLEAIAGREPLAESAYDELNFLIPEWDIDYVLIHLDMLSNSERETLPPFFAAHPSLCFWRQEGDLLAFQRRPEAGCALTNQVDLDAGSASDLAFMGPGWYLPEDIGGVNGRWANTEAILRFDLEPTDYQLSFRALAYPADQELTVIVNNMVIDTMTLANGWQTYELSLPQELILSSQPTILTFNHPQAQSANEQTGGVSPDIRPLAAAYDWVRITPISK